jgi:hypothetical protein
LLRGLSLGDTQDCIICRFHHGGALALREPMKATAHPTYWPMVPRAKIPQVCLHRSS